MTESTDTVPEFKQIRTADDLIIDAEQHWCVSDIKTSEQAAEARGRLLIDCARIEAQLDEAQEYFVEHGQHRDLSWMRKAKLALSFKKAALQRVQEVGGALKRREKAATNLRVERLLITALREHIGDDKFFEILERVQSGIGESADV